MLTDAEPYKPKRKIEAGADYVMTQPVFDIETLVKIHEATHALGVPVFIGLTPLTSERNAIFLHHEVPSAQSGFYLRHSGHTDGL